MSRKRHRNRGSRTTPKGTQPHERPGPRHGMPPLVREAQTALERPSPLALLEMASGIVELTTPRGTDRFTGRQPGNAEEVFRSLVDSEWPSMSALAWAVAALHPDEVLAASLRRKIPASVLLRGPMWLTGIGDIVITEVQRTTDALGDGENLMISWRWPGGQSATMVVYVDHNLGTIVKDAFSVPESAAGMRTIYAKIDDPNVSVEHFEPADARAHIVEAITTGERMVPIVEGDGWPTSRPLVEWLLRHLPAGGNGYEWPDWSEKDRERLLDDFVGSSHGTVDGLSAEHVRFLAEPLVWFACDYGPGDPLRWSPVSVEIVLVDWYPRKVISPARDLERLPDVLAAFVRFAHEIRHISPALTSETLDAIQRWRREFDEAIRGPRRTPAANAMRLARLAAGWDPDDFSDDFDLDSGDQEQWMATTLDATEAAIIDRAGGRDALDSLDDLPLPDTPFDWTRVPAEISERTKAALAAIDLHAAELFDKEVATIARALMAEVISEDPGVLKRSRPDVLAAAMLWFASKHISSRLAPELHRAMPWRCSTQKQLAEAVGISPSALSQRYSMVASMLERADVDWSSVLHSQERRMMLETMAMIREWRSDHDDES